LNIEQLSKAHILAAHLGNTHGKQGKVFNLGLGDKPFTKWAGIACLRVIPSHLMLLNTFFGTNRELREIIFFSSHVPHFAAKLIMSCAKCMAWNL